VKLLAWDTSSKQGVLAALEWDEKAKVGTRTEDVWKSLRLVAECSLNVEVTHSERLLWAINQTLESTRWKLEDVDLFAVGVGPGSFTSLRVGITTARTLAHTMGKPLIGVSSLAALARPVAQWLSAQKSKALVVATTDAAKGELFALWGAASSVTDCVVMAEGDLPGVWKRGVDERALPAEELIAELQASLKSKGGRKSEGSQGSGDSYGWIAVGEGRDRYPEEWKKLSAKAMPELKPPVPFADHVQGRYVALLGWEAFQAGAVRDALNVFPRYIRAPDAELKLKAGLLPPGPSRGE
jgi:tRNA threonylcarbamoyl adenosine modification protein YeaZ